MDFTIILLLVMLMLIGFLLYFMDPFDEMKLKTESDTVDDGGAGQVAQRYATALRQRPPSHINENAAMGLPRPNVQMGGHRVFHGAGAPPAGSSKIPKPWGPPGNNPPYIHQQGNHGLKYPFGEANNYNLNRGHQYHAAQPDDLSPQAPAPAPQVVPAVSPTPLSNQLTAPAGLKRSKPLVSFDHAAPWLRARTRSNSLDPDSEPPTIVASEPSVEKGTTAVESVAPKTSSTKSSTMQLLDLSDIQLQSIVGGGAFGQVWKGLWHGTPVAVKTIPMLSLPQPGASGNGADPALLQAFEDEVQIFASLRHPNITLFIGACLSMPTRAIVTELVPRGSLWEALRTPGLFEKSDGSSYFWPWWVTRRVLEGVCRGLIYLHHHSPPIIHRDLKSANVLLDESFNPKICDFGLARLKDLNKAMTANVGTAQWMSPEVISGNQYNEKADVYSLAMVGWETITGKCPFEGMSQLEVVVAVSQGNQRPVVPTWCDPALRDLLQRCWHADASRRMTAKEALLALGSCHGGK